VAILHGAYYRTTIAVVAGKQTDAPGRCQPVALYEQRQPQLSCCDKMSMVQKRLSMAKIPGISDPMKFG
jgi:hypothetical protein